jgi:hypothetical protein
LRPHTSDASASQWAAFAHGVRVYLTRRIEGAGREVGRRVALHIDEEAGQPGRVVRPLQARHERDEHAIVGAHMHDARVVAHAVHAKRGRLHSGRNKVEGGEGADEDEACTGERGGSDAAEQPIVDERMVQRRQKVD